MRRRTILIISIVLLLIILISVIINIHNQSPATRNEHITQIDKALESEWTKQSETVVTPILYENPQGDTIIYYLCATTYYEAAPPETNRLNMDVINLVMDDITTASSRTCSVKEYEAVLYGTSDRSYLCWTLSSEYTCILEYSPDSVSESDIFKTAESILLPDTPQ